MNSITAPPTVARPNVAPPLSPPESASHEAPIIETRDVSLTFAENAGVHELSFAILPGTIFGLIGPSGCGKTTTVRLLTGLYKPAQGELRVMNEVPARFSARTRERIGYMPQHFVLYPQLTAWENLNFVASLYGLPFLRRRKRLNQLLDLIELRDARNRLGSQLSGGMQRRLELAAGLVNDPLLLFLDEPTAGIDPVLRRKFWDYFRVLRDQGRTLFVTTQYVGEAVYCDYVGIMRAGRLLFVDTPQNLRRRALGGEVIRLVTAPAQEREALRRLDALPEVSQVRRSREAGQLYVYSEDAAKTLPLLVTTLNNAPAIEVQQIDKFEPPFDDVFVHLIQEDEQND